MNYRALTQTIARVLSSVEGVGKVHEFRRFAVTPDDIKTLFVADGSLNGWTVSRGSFSNEHIRTDQTHEKIHSFVIRGLFAHNDDTSSELVFNEIIDRIVDRFAPSSDLGEEIEIAGPIVAREIDYSPLSANTLCHYCELELAVKELSTY